MMIESTPESREFDAAFNTESTKSVTVVAYDSNDAVNKAEAIEKRFPGSTVDLRNGFHDDNSVNTDVIAMDVYGVNESELYEMVTEMTPRVDGKEFAEALTQSPRGWDAIEGD